MPQAILSPSHRDALLAFAASAYARRPLPAIEDWPALFTEAFRHGLIPLADYRLHMEPGVPQPVRQLFHTHALLLAGRQAYLERQTTAVLAALARAGVQAVLLKGFSVARSFYPRPALRTFSDVDIWVQEADWAKTYAVLVAEGFQPRQNHPTPPPRVSPNKTYYHSQYDRERDGIRVEVHYDLWWYGLRPRLREEIWRRTTQIEVGDGCAQVLSVEDLLLHLCLHLHHHGFNRLIWFTDLALILTRVPALDWDRFIETARTEGAGVLAYYSLRHAQALLGVAVPPPVLRALQPNALQARLHEMLWPTPTILALQVQDRAVCDFHEVPDVDELLLNLVLTGRRWEKLAYLYHLLTPSRAWLQAYYATEDPATLRRRRLLHPFALLRRALRQLLRLTRQRDRHPLYWNNPTATPFRPESPLATEA